MIAQLTILTNEKHSGKTTQLLRFIEYRNDIVGVLTPIINNKRCFYNIETKEVFNMEFNDEVDDESIPIGKYLFSKKGFEKANKILQQCHYNKIIVIDELGPLELADKGFCKSIQLLLQTNNHLLLIIRNSLVVDAIKYFNIHKYKMIHNVNEIGL